MYIGQTTPVHLQRCSHRPLDGEYQPSSLYSEEALFRQTLYQALLIVLVSRMSIESVLKRDISSLPWLRGIRTMDPE